MKRWLPGVLAMLLAFPASAQIISVPDRGLTRQPAIVLTTTVGIQALQGVFDGSTGTAWDFSQGIEYGASIERALGGGSAFGIAASYSRVPLRYVDSTSVTSSGQIICCDAHVNVYTAGAQFSAGGGEGFHQVIVASAGVIVFQDFTLDDGGKVPPGRDIDPRLSIGYGIGYGFSRRSQAFLLQEYAVALHQGENLSGDDRRQYQQQTTRVGFRLGLP